MSTEVKNIEVKRIDHLGIVAGTIRHLDIIKLIDEEFGIDDQEHISTGEAVAGMIMNALGFVSQPLMLTPQFFQNKALEHLIKEGVEADNFNRHKLGRTLDNIANYGCSKLFNKLALHACAKEGVDMKFGHGDTTSISFSGEYDVDSDTERLRITHGHSKDMRPDMKQVILELMTTQDAGIPFIMQAWNGNASDSIILRERAKTLVEEFARSGSRCIITDCKLYAKETAEVLNKVNFITRVPSTIKLESEFITKALMQPQLWESIGNGYKLQEFPSECYNIENQRWVVVYSEQARERAQKTLDKAVIKEKEQADKYIFHLQANRFSCESDAQKAVATIAKKLHYHTISTDETVHHKGYAKKGRPTKDTPVQMTYQIKASVAIDTTAFNQELNQRSCFILATNMDQTKVPKKEVLLSYKGQDNTEKGFAFLKSPEFFTSSLFLKKPERIEAMLMVMVLSLLVYSIAQRQVRKSLEATKQTIPNQINKQVTNPTTRWIFQLFQGIDFVTICLNSVKETILIGLTELKKTILMHLSPDVQKIYQISLAGG